MDLILFCVALISLFWISGDIYTGFQNQDGLLILHTSSPRQDELTSAVMPDNLLSTNIVAELFYALTFSSIRGSGCRTCVIVCGRCTL